MRFFKLKVFLTVKLCETLEVVTQESKVVVVMGDFNLIMMSVGSSAQTLQLSG